MSGEQESRRGELLTVGLDFDDTAVPFRAPFIDWYNLEAGVEIDHTVITEYDLSVCMGLSSRQEVEVFVDRYHENEMQNPELSISEEAAEALVRLSTYFHFPVISARKCKFKSYTLAQMAMVLPDREPEAYHREDYESLDLTKGTFAKKKLDAVALLDDHVLHAESALEAGIEGILVGDQLNQGYTGKAFRAESWLQIEEKLMEVREHHFSGYRRSSVEHNSGQKALGNG